jgi:cysteine synthase
VCTRSVYSEILTKISRTRETSLSAFGQRTVARLERQVRNYPVTPMSCYQVDVHNATRVVRLKLEGESPWGSIKGRTAIGLVASLLHQVTPRTRIVESTSGNLGVALACLTRNLGLGFTAVIDDRLPTAMSCGMRAAQAQFISAVPDQSGGGRLAARLAVVAWLAGSDADVIWPNQYENNANPLIHEIWTGSELAAQAPRAQAVFIGVSTGGALAGVSRAVRRAMPNCKVVGVDVEGSQVFGRPVAPRVLTGIGASMRSRHLDSGDYDAVEIVSSWSGIAQCRAWEESAGLRLGGSAGAVLAACMKHLAAHPELTDVVCLCADLGENYRDTVYDDAWVQCQRAAEVARGRDAAWSPSYSGVFQCGVERVQ